MKGFEREDQLFSLCGLNCGLCSMHLGGYCPGCGGGAGNQACAIARCAMQKEDTPLYCSACSEFPCERYAEPDAYDSFITHRNRMQDFMRMHTIGAAAYHKEQLEKIEILKEENAVYTCCKSAGAEGAERCHATFIRSKNGYVHKKGKSGACCVSAAGGRC